MIDPSAPNRTSRVISIKARQDNNLRRGLFDERAKEKGIKAEKLWLVSIEIKSGSRPTTVAFDVFENEEEANAYMSKHPVGSVWAASEHMALKGDLQEYLGKLIFHDEKAGSILLTAGGSDDGYLAWKVKEDAGFFAFGDNDKVHSFLGNERVEELRKEYGGNWAAAADMEYSWHKLPASSAAYIAAQHEYHEYITNDEFSAGYLLRDLEILYYGVEDASNRAAEFSERQAQRSAQGGKAHAEKAAQRKRVIYRLALESSSQWIWRSEREQVRQLRKLAEDHDRENGERLFHHSNKLLSFSWFQDALADLRNSGELQRLLEGKKP